MTLAERLRQERDRRTEISILAIRARDFRAYEKHVAAIEAFERALELLDEEEAGEKEPARARA